MTVSTLNGFVRLDKSERVLPWARKLIDDLDRLLALHAAGINGSAGVSAPDSATYVTLSTNATLLAERVLTAGAGISLTDTGAGGTLTIATTGGGGGAEVYNEVPTGAKPGTAFTLSQTPIAGTARPYLNGTRMRQVGGSPGKGEYTLSGAVITTGATVQTTDQLWVDYEVTVIGTRIFNEVPSGAVPGTAFVLAFTPTDNTVVQPYVNGARLRQVGSSPGKGEYTVSGATITTGFTVTGSIWVDYEK